MGGVFRSDLVGAIPVSDDCRGRQTLSFQQLTHQAQRRIHAAFGSDQESEHFALIIDGAPQIHLPAADRDKDFVEMPPPG
jgi:hypothetical protein